MRVLARSRVCEGASSRANSWYVRRVRNGNQGIYIIDKIKGGESWEEMRLLGDVYVVSVAWRGRCGIDSRRLVLFVNFQLSITILCNKELN